MPLSCSLRSGRATSLLFAIVGCAMLFAASSRAVADPTTDVRLHVVLLPFIGGPDIASQKQGQDALSPLADQINKDNPLYIACVKAAKSAIDDSSCDATRASILINTSYQTDPKTPKVVLSAVDPLGHRALGVVTKPFTLTFDKNGTQKFVLTLTAAEEQSLLGTVQVGNGTLTTTAAQPFVQLIPDVASSQPTYADLLQSLLARRGIASLPSTVNAGTVTSGNVGADVLCGLNQRYVVYSIAQRNEDRLLSLNTRVETRMTGHLYDCVTRSDLSFGTSNRTFATQTAGPIPKFIALLKLLFISKNDSWGNALTAGTAVSAIVDQTPADIQGHTAEITMQAFVDNFCTRLKALPTPPPPPPVVLQVLPTPSPTPSPTPTPTPKPTPTPGTSVWRNLDFNIAPPGSGSAPNPPTKGATGAGNQPGSSSASGAPSTTPLDVGQFVALTPPKLTCTNAPYAMQSPIPARAPLFNRRP